MNRYLLYRRIRGPVFLLTFGVTALLAQWDVLGFDRSWPLYLIVAGLLRLIENATFASYATLASGVTGAAAYPATGYAPVAGWEQGSSQPPGTSLATTGHAGPLQTASPSTVYNPVHEEER